MKASKKMISFNSKKGQHKTEAVVHRCSVKKMFLKISPSTQETLAQMFSCGFFEIFKNRFSHRLPPAAASDKRKCSVDSISEPQSHMGLMVSLKLCRNSCSFN